MFYANSTYTTWLLRSFVLFSIAFKCLWMLQCEVVLTCFFIKHAPISRLYPIFFCCSTVNEAIGWFCRWAMGWSWSVPWGCAQHGQGLLHLDTRVCPWSLLFRACGLSGVWPVFLVPDSISTIKPLKCLWLYLLCQFCWPSKCCF